MRIAHISDLHVVSLDDVKLSRFLSKRVTGIVNLMTFRKGGFSILVLEKLVEDLIREDYDHVVVTGDLSNMALHPEFERVARLLNLVGGYDKVSVVPGNHDHYTAGAIRTSRFEKYFYRYMFPTFTDLDTDLYPYKKRLGDVTIFGLDSAIQTPPLFAYGMVDPDQIARFMSQVSAPGVEDTFKIVLVHHHFHSRGLVDDMTSRLVNHEALEKIFLETKVDLVLHGHDHKPHFGSIAGNAGKIPIICAGSSTKIDPNPAKCARYNVYHIEDRSLAKMETKIYDPRRRRFIWKF